MTVITRNESANIDAALESVSWADELVVVDAESIDDTAARARRRGARVEIRLMSGEPPLRGHVDSLSHGITIRDNPDGPELLANVNPTFEWVRLAQRIPVRIHIDNVPTDVLISSGMTCTVIVDRKSTRLNSSHSGESRMPSSA